MEKWNNESNIAGVSLSNKIKMQANVMLEIGLSVGERFGKQFEKKTRYFATSNCKNETRTIVNQFLGIYRQNMKKKNPKPFQKMFGIVGFIDDIYHINLPLISQITNVSFRGPNRFCKAHCEQFPSIWFIKLFFSQNFIEMPLLPNFQQRQQTKQPNLYRTRMGKYPKYVYYSAILNPFRN